MKFTQKYLQRYESLNQHLSTQRHYWQLRPYHVFDYPWRSCNPALADFLDGLDDTAIDRLDPDFYALSQALAAFIPSAQELYQLSQMPPPTTAAAAFPIRLQRAIPGRKWQQISAFVAHLDATHTPLPWLDWCAGKGHLGRLLAHHSGQPVDCIERNPDLCRQGRELAADLPLQFHCADVLAPASAGLLQPDQHAVALHACGGLHLQLLRLSVAHGLRAISLVPCCYHLIASPVYQPLSQAARNTTLRLERQDLQLPSQELLVGGQRRRRLRENEVQWRLGFDSLQRDLRAQNTYLPVPNVRESVLNQDFQTFCQWAAARKDLHLPTSVDWHYYETLGRQRRQRVKRMSLVRHLFRRPLEIWLLLDRALFMAEHGYRVSLQAFCERHQTPRNLLLQARR